MTKLTKPIERETGRVFATRPVIVTLAPGGQNEALIGLRLKGKRTQYVCALSDIYRLAAMWHGQKEAAACIGRACSRFRRSAGVAGDLIERREQ